ncbi:hypothetical protein DW741_01240 [Ruminococcaceae bacterium AM28-23LB]|nr:hypothetical protein DW741_01240 [Ruminococcaceae bacterium AM28-23LB]
MLALMSVLPEVELLLPALWRLTDIIQGCMLQVNMYQQLGPSRWKWKNNFIIKRGQTAPF